MVRCGVLADFGSLFSGHFGSIWMLVMFDDKLSIISFQVNILAKYIVT
jgi:hypothetical protein